ncbi:MAG: FtsX-like permease family protein [Rhodospirillaceae bacterium]|nr:FtsX-like permease family protein [Rhodospirillaceae bacterium]
MALFHHAAMAARIAIREMRGGLRGLWLLVAGVFIGAAAVALVGATSQSLMDGARQGGLESIGGDLSLRLFHRPPSKAEHAAMRREGIVSTTAELRPMARALKSGDASGPPLLIELKGVDQQYPLYGTVEVQPAINVQNALERRDGEYGAIADRALFDAMGLSLGDHVQIGGTRYQLRGTLSVEPDRSFRAFALGPRMIVSGESLAATGLTGAGAEVYYYSRVKLPAGSNAPDDAKAALARIDREFPQSGWRMVNAHDGVPGLERALEMTHVLVLFIGLGVMLVGGAGISGAVRAHIADKVEVIAILKSVGAPPRVVTLAIGFEIMAMAFVGCLLGAGVGAAGPALAASALDEHLPFALETLPRIKPLLAAGLFGMLVAALFAWWPLMGVRHMKAQALLRARISPSHEHSNVAGWLVAGLIVLALVALVFWVSPMPVMTVAFLVGALALAAIYFGLGVALSRLARFSAQFLTRFPTRIPTGGNGATVRLALGNLYRAGAPTGPVVMALGLTLTLLVALDGVGVAASRHIQKSLPQTAPDLVAFSLKPETARQLALNLAEVNMLNGARIMPFLHARVQAIGSIPVAELDLPASMNWVIRGDRGVSFAAELADGPSWNAAQSGRSGFSVDIGIAKKLGLNLGDTITMNIGGEVRTGEIFNFRSVDWTGLDLDFPIIATPVTFAGIPYTLAASLKAKPGAAAALEAHVKTHFPGVPLVRVEDVLESFSTALDTLLLGLRTATLMWALAALMVLAGSVFQGLRERTNDAMLFKVLGARRRQLLGQVVAEFLGLGILVAIAAVPLGLGIAYGMARAAGVGGVNVSWAGGGQLAIASILVTVAVGLAATLGAYRAKPAQMLRARKL